MPLLTDVVERLGDVVRVLPGCAVAAREVSTCAVIDPTELHGDPTDRSDEVLLLLASLDATRGVVGDLRSRRPALVIVKTDDNLGWESVARQSSVPVGVVREDVTWSQLHGLITSLIRATSSTRADTAGADDMDASSQGDLFDLAISLSTQVRGYVTIDDAHTRVLAFSPLDEHADELRRASVLGRAAPPGHLEQIRSMGLWDALRRGELVELPGTVSTMPRLGIGLIDPYEGHYVGVIWVQQGVDAFAPRARQLLRAAGVVAAGMIGQRSRIRNRDRSLLSRLLGLSESRESPRTLATALGLDSVHTWALGAIQVRRPGHSGPALARAATTVQLEAATVGRGSRILDTPDILYVVMLEVRPKADLEAWATRTSATLAAYNLAVRVAVGPVGHAAEELPSMREACDALLAEIPVDDDRQIRTYEAHRAEVALAQVVRVLKGNGLLTQERIEALATSKYVDGDELAHTIATYLRSNLNTGATAAELSIHPNTLRQRLKRVELTAGVDLSNAADRLLLELELRAASIWSGGRTGG